jgi:hypothetical protein
LPYVDSSAISRIEYDPSTRQLFVTFRGGGTYTYYGVPPEVYEAFLRAPSKGRFHAEHIHKRYQTA